jgi:hypothetical protein
MGHGPQALRVAHYAAAQIQRTALQAQEAKIRVYQLD